MVSLSHWLADGGCARCKHGDKIRQQKDEKRRKEDIRLCAEMGVEYIGCHRESENGNARIYVDFICSKHRDKGAQKIYRSNMSKIKIFCRYCNPYMHYTHDEINEMLSFHEKDFEFLSDDYSALDDKILCRCRIHDYISKIRIKSILAGCGCEKCRYEKTSQALTLSEKEIADRINDSDFDVEYVSGYIGMDFIIKVKCKKCGCIYETSPRNISKCPECDFYYRGEKLTSDCLKDNNINYLTQYIFKDCIYINPLRFDFYLPDYNTCVEYNGQQHYKPVMCFGGEERFKDQQIRDNIKRQYCKDNGIKLIEIPYTYNTKEKIESYLKENM